MLSPEERWAVCMSEAGYPKKLTKSDHPHALNGAGCTPPFRNLEELRVSYKAHQIARTGRADIMTENEYVEWWQKEMGQRVLS